MHLEAEFRKSVEEIANMFVFAVNAMGGERKELHDRWKYDSEFNFMLGYTAGVLEGMSTGVFIQKYTRKPTEQESAEIREIITLYADGIRERVSKYFS